MVPAYNQYLEKGGKPITESGEKTLEDLRKEQAKEKIDENTDKFWGKIKVIFEKND